MPEMPTSSPDQTYEAVCASWHAAQPAPRQMPWRVAVEILAVVKKLSAEERDKLLALDDEPPRRVLTDADAAADLAGTPRPDNPSA